MVTLALALALVQAREFSEFTHVVRRVDCRATLRRDSGSGEYGFPRDVEYVFLFLERENRTPRRRRLLYVTTSEDGATSLDRGFVTAERDRRWPNFSASLQFHGGTATLASDPQTPRRIVYRSVQTGSLNRIVGEGTCETFPRDRRARP